MKFLSKSWGTKTTATLFSVLLVSLLSTHVWAVDTDGDGVTDINDFDQDGDGILNTEEGISFFFPLDLSGITGGSPNVSGGAAAPPGLGVTTTFNGNVIASNSSDGARPRGLNNGSIGFGLGNGAFANGEFVEYEFVFDQPTTIELSQAAANGFFDRSEKWTISVDGTTLSVNNPSINSGNLPGGSSPELNSVTGDGTSQVGFTPATSGGHIDPATSQWSIVTDGLTNRMVIRYEATTFASAGSNQRGTLNINITSGVIDSDGDGILDYRDIDSDNDGITDLIESGANASVVDANNDGIYDGTVNAQGIPVDANTDAGITPVDTDNDGNNDYLDLDSDNDGITDTNEAGGIDADGNGLIDGFVDTDGDGWNDPTTAAPLPIDDIDGDGTPNHLDIDSDNDGIDDIIESRIG